MAKAKKKVETGKEKTPVVYIGPGFKDSLLSTYMVFADGTPAEFQQDPVLKHLFVPPEDLNRARAEVARQGSSLHIFYHEALKQHAKGAKK